MAELTENNIPENAQEPAGDKTSGLRNLAEKIVPDVGNAVSAMAETTIAGQAVRSARLTGELMDTMASEMVDVETRENIRQSLNIRRMQEELQTSVIKEQQQMQEEANKEGGLNGIAEKVAPDVGEALGGVVSATPVGKVVTAAKVANLTAGVTALGVASQLPPVEGKEGQEEQQQVQADQKQPANKEASGAAPAPSEAKQETAQTSTEAETDKPQEKSGGFFDKITGWMGDNPGTTGAIGMGLLGMMLGGGGIGGLLLGAIMALVGAFVAPQLFGNKQTEEQQFVAGAVQHAKSIDKDHNGISNQQELEAAFDAVNKDRKLDNMRKQAAELRDEQKGQQETFNEADLLVALRKGEMPVSEALLKQYNVTPEEVSSAHFPAAAPNTQGHQR